MKKMCENCAAPDIHAYLADLTDRQAMAKGNLEAAETSEVRDPYLALDQLLSSQIRRKKTDLSTATSSCRACIYKAQG
jgi:hypothetical protein